MHYASICIWAESEEERAAFEEWRRTWRRKIACVSEDYGCGCCIHLFDVSGRKEAIDAIPERLLICAPWAGMTGKPHTGHTGLTSSPGDIPS